MILHAFRAGAGSRVSSGVHTCRGQSMPSKERSVIEKSVDLAPKFKRAMRVDAGKISLGDCMDGELVIVTRRAPIIIVLLLYSCSCFHLRLEGVQGASDNFPLKVCVWCHASHAETSV